MTTIDAAHEYDHLRAFYDASAQLLDQPDAVLFGVNGAVSGWSPAHHLHHIWVANGRSLAAVLHAASGRGADEGGPNQTGRVVLERGTIPRNRMDAPATVQPPDDLDRAALREALARSRDKLDAIEADLDALPDAKGRIPHPRMGALNAAEWLRFVRIHSDHHHAIIQEILRDSD